MQVGPQAHDRQQAPGWRLSVVPGDEQFGNPGFQDRQGQDVRSREQIGHEAKGGEKEKGSVCGTAWCAMIQSPAVRCQKVSPSLSTSGANRVSANIVTAAIHGGLTAGKVSLDSEIDCWDIAAAYTLRLRI